MPKVSIIVAVYNVEPYLRRSMDCLMNQTLKDLEFICIDDCSTDGSLAILKEYAEKDSRFKIIESQQNGGAAVARNKGLEVATGEYLGFIDPDDAIDLNYYEELYNKAKEGDYDIVKCYRKNIFPNGDVMLGKISKHIKEHGLYYFGSEWTTAIYKSSIIFENGIKFPAQIRKGQDAVFLNSIILNSKSIALIDNVCYYYYRRNSSLNAEKLSVTSVKSACCAYSIMLDDLNKSNLFVNDEKTYIQYYERILHNIFHTLNSRNQSKEAKIICAETIISDFYKCKDINKLKKIYRYKAFLKYIEKKDIKNLAKCLKRCKNAQDCLSDYSFLEKLFSVKNIKRNKKKYKVLTILGIKLKFRLKFYEIEEKLNSMNLLMQQQQQQIEELAKQKEEFEKQNKKNNELSKFFTMIPDEVKIEPKKPAKATYKISENKIVTGQREPFFEIAKNYITPDSKILDIGCGDCSFAKYINRPDTYCLDGNIESINSIKDTFKNAVCAQLPNLPFEDNSFDLIHSSHCVEHLYPQELYNLLKEIDRCLKPGGYLIISAPTMWSKFYMDLSHIKPYYPIIFYRYLCEKYNRNRTRPMISNKYNCIREVYRYHELPYENLEICPDNEQINRFLNESNEFKYKQGIRKIEKSGYTIVLKKNDV